VGYGLGFADNTTVQVCHVVYSAMPDKHQLVRVALDLDEERWIEHACQAAGRNLSREEWERYMGQEPYRAMCDQWPAGN
jgi:hypothetical protein